MTIPIDALLAQIEKRYGHKIEKGARNYLEIRLADQARQMGYDDLPEPQRYASAIVPLKKPQPGMKVRIDGRTFINYAEADSGVALPGYLVRDSQRAYRTYVPWDSMVCNFC